MTDLVERVARAIGENISEATDYYGSGLEEAARAAIAVVLEAYLGWLGTDENFSQCKGFVKGFAAAHSIRLNPKERP